MRHYQLIPVRYNEQQLLVRCEPVDAELWSIQWHTLGAPIDPVNEFGIRGAQPVTSRTHWFADVSPLERSVAVCIVQWLNDLESGRVNAPALTEVI